MHLTPDLRPLLARCLERSLTQNSGSAVSSCLFPVHPCKLMLSYTNSQSALSPYMLKCRRWFERILSCRQCPSRQPYMLALNTRTCRLYASATFSVQIIETGWWCNHKPRALVEIYRHTQLGIFKHLMRVSKLDTGCLDISLAQACTCVSCTCCSGCCCLCLVPMRNLKPLSSLQSSHLPASLRLG